MQHGTESKTQLHLPNHTRILRWLSAQPGRGATGRGDARSSGAHPPLRTAAACTRSERRRMPRPRKPARPLSACRRDHRGLVGWQWWAARCCAAGDSAAARRVASAANHTPGSAAGGSGPPAARGGKSGCEARFSRFAKLPNLSFGCTIRWCTTSATAATRAGESARGGQCPAPSRG